MKIENLSIFNQNYKSNKSVYKTIYRIFKGIIIKQREAKICIRIFIINWGDDIHLARFLLYCYAIV